MNLASASMRSSARAFTLVELIAVMALLVTVIAIASPSLAGFFRSRSVDAEARRFLSLTRAGQSRAAAEGITMILWVDQVQRSYGLEADSSFVEDDARAVTYSLDSNVTLEIGANELVQGAISSETLFGNTSTPSRHGSLPQIRFEPDGAIAVSSPENFRLTDRDGNSLWVGLTANRLNYEVRNQAAQRVRQQR